MSHGQVIGKGQTSKRKRKKPRKLKIRKSESPTFKTYHISRLKKGKLKFKLKANSPGRARHAGQADDSAQRQQPLTR